MEGVDAAVVFGHESQQTRGAAGDTRILGADIFHALVVPYRISFAVESDEEAGTVEGSDGGDGLEARIEGPNAVEAIAVRDDADHACLVVDRAEDVVLADLEEVGLVAAQETLVGDSAADRIRMAVDQIVVVGFGVDTQTHALGGGGGAKRQEQQDGSGEKGFHFHGVG